MQLLLPAWRACLYRVPRSPGQAGRAAVRAAQPQNVKQQRRPAAIADGTAAIQQQQQKQQQQDPSALARRLRGARTRQEVAALVRANLPVLKAVHIAAAFKALVALAKPTQQQRSTQSLGRQAPPQSSEQLGVAPAVEGLLLQSATACAAAFKPPERRLVLWAVTQLRLQPSCDWYCAMLLQSGGSSSGNGSSSSSTASQAGVGGPLLTQLISNTTSCDQLQAVLHCCRPQLELAHIAAALQQLAGLRQHRHHQTQRDQGQRQQWEQQEQQQQQQQLGKELLQQAAAAVSAAAGGTGAVQLRGNLRLSARTAAVMLKSAAALQLQLPGPHQQQQLFLISVLQQALQPTVPGDKALSAAGLSWLVEGAAWFMLQQPSQPQEPRQHGPSHSKSSAAERQQQEQQAQRQQQRQLLLQLQQRQAATAAAAAAGQRAQATALQHHQHEALLLLAAIVEAFCARSTKQQQEAVPLYTVACLLAALEQLQMLPGDGWLEQLLAAAGTCEAGGGSSILMTAAPGCNAHAAAAVLRELAELAALEQQQRLLLVARSSSSSSQQVVGPVLCACAPRLLAIVCADDRAFVRDLCVALSAAAQLVAMQSAAVGAAVLLPAKALQQLLSRLAVAAALPNQRWQLTAADVAGAVADAHTLARHMLSDSGGTQGIAPWLQRFVAGSQPQLAASSAQQLRVVFQVLADHQASLPHRWLRVAEGWVLTHMERLGQEQQRQQGQQQGQQQEQQHRQQQEQQQEQQQQEQQQQEQQQQEQQQLATVAQLLEAWSQVLLAQQRCRPYATTSVYRCSEQWCERLCCGLQPRLACADAATLAALAWSVGSIGCMPSEAWQRDLLAATAAVVTQPAAAAAGPTFDPGVLLQLLQSLLLLRCRPPLPLLRLLLQRSSRDLAFYKGSELVRLLLQLVQMRVRPGPSWMRGFLLRAQGKLRMMSFNELTQLCWSVAQLGLVPTQAWQEDFADAAAVHVIAKRRMERQQQQQEVQQQRRHPEQVTPAGGANTGACPAVGPGGRSGWPVTSADVHYWQMRAMHWALLSCWQFRSSHPVGKLHFRLVRELDRAMWGMHLRHQQRHARLAAAANSTRRRLHRQRRHPRSSRALQLAANKPGDRGQLVGSAVARRHVLSHARRWRAAAMWPEQWQLLRA